MSSAPEQPQAMVPLDLGHVPDLLAEVALGVGDVLADGGVELDIALEKLGFDRVFQVPVLKLAHDLTNPTAAAIVWLSTRLSSSSTPIVGCSLFVTNL